MRLVLSTKPAPEHPRGRRRSGAHASGWALRHTRVSTPAHAVVPEHAKRPFGMAIRVLTAALVAALGLFVGTAYASFTSSGSGSGDATTGTLQSVTIEASATPTSTLLPGGKADLALTVANPNSFPVTMTAVSPGSGPVTVTGAVGCSATDADVSVTAKVGLRTTLTPGTSTVDIATGAVMGAGSASACQHATFHIPITLTVQK